MRTVYLIIFTSMLILFWSGNVFGQESEVVNSQRIFLNDINDNDLVSLNESQLLLSAKSLRSEDLTCRISKGNKLVKEFIIPLTYGINNLDISVEEFRSKLDEGELYNFHFAGRYFGKGHFRFKTDNSMVLNTPLLNIQTNPIEVNCESEFNSTIEFFGSVSGGSAPYKLTWFVSKGPYLGDLLSPPIDFELTNSQDINEMLVGEPLDYFVTLLVEDACGNTNKQVIHVMCDDKENNGMIYFQPIEVPKIKSEL